MLALTVFKSALNRPSFGKATLSFLWRSSRTLSSLSLAAREFSSFQLDDLIVTSACAKVLFSAFKGLEGLLGSSSTPLMCFCCILLAGYVVYTTSLQRIKELEAKRGESLRLRVSVDPDGRYRRFRGRNRSQRVCCHQQPKLGISLRVRTVLRREELCREPSL